MTRARRILLIALAALVASLMAGLLSRDALASFIAARSLAKKGFECAAIAVHAPVGFPVKLELAPTHCKVREGPLESITFKEPLFIRLDGVECASLEINLRPAAPREVDRNTLGSLSSIVGLDGPVLEMMFDSAKLSSDRNPSLLATRAVLRRAGKPVSSYQDLRVVSSDEGTIITSPAVQVAQATVLGPGALRLTATPTAVTLSVVFAKDLRVKVVLDHIDATKPSADFNIAIGESAPSR